MDEVDVMPGRGETLFITFQPLPTILGDGESRLPLPLER